MACENGRASGCTPASASEKSLKVGLYRMAKSQLFHPLTTWGSMHALIRTWLTTFWCAPCMFLLATMIFDHRCQLPPDLNHYCFHTWNFFNPNTCNPNQYRNAFSKYLYSWTAVFLPQPFFNLLKASDKFRSIRSMPIPAETVLENRQVNELLPSNIVFWTFGLSQDGGSGGNSYPSKLW